MPLSGECIGEDGVIATAQPPTAPQLASRLVVHRDTRAKPHARGRDQAPLGPRGSQREERWLGARVVRLLHSPRLTAMAMAGGRQSARLGSYARRVVVKMGWGFGHPHA